MSHRRWLIGVFCGFGLALALGAVPSPPYYEAWGEAVPTLRVIHSLDVSSIFLKGEAGVPQTAKVTLSLEAGGAGLIPLDLMLVLDRSATTDPAVLREIGEAFLARLSPEDRVGVVSFAEEARVDLELTSSIQMARKAIAALRVQGKTAVGDGLFEATQALLRDGREEALWVEVLVTDGRANAGRDPLIQAQRAADNGILVFTIGLGRHPDEALLSGIAEAAGGAFFRAFSPDAVDEVFGRTELEVVARDIVITETLAPEFAYEQAFLRPPDRVGEYDPQAGTTLEWTVRELALNERWTATFTVSGIRRGTYSLNRAPSQLVYTDFRGRRQTLALPVLTLEVRVNQPPQADFSFSPEQPSVRDEVVFLNASRDPDGEITACLWDFGDGSRSTLCQPTHRYAQDGTYTVTLTVTDDAGATHSTSRTLTVRANQPPQADFSFTPEQPSMRDEVAFADDSSDPDGQIIAWLWDFGDGTTSTEQNPTHRYTQDGTYTVTLTVTDDDGATHTISRTVTVSTVALRAERAIDTFLPTDVTLAGEVFQVTVTIEVNRTLNGLGLDEDLPPEWPVTPVDNGGARFKADELQWVFLEVLRPGDTLTVVYEVTVPENAQPGVYNLNGIVTSASPRVEQNVTGETQLEVQSSLPVEVVVSRWDVQADRLDLRLSNQITFDQVQLAVAWWIEGVVVPLSGGQVIDFLTIQEIIARWLTDTPIGEPLPGG